MEFKTGNGKLMDFSVSQNLHGDVIIEILNEVPKNFEYLKKDETGVLAYGEVTGHSHKLFRKTEFSSDGSSAFELRVTGDGVKLLKVNETVALRHQEHDERLIPPGVYKIGIQREYDPFRKLARSVAD